MKLTQILFAKFLDGTTYVAYRYKSGYLCRIKSPWLTVWSEWEDFNSMLKDIRYEKDLHDHLPHEDEVKLKFTPVPDQNQTEDDDEIPF